MIVFERISHLGLAAMLVGCQPHTIRAPIEYPRTETVDHFDDYHGTRVADPYRSLEDPDSAATREWIEAQNRLTRSFLNEIPARRWIRRRLEQLWNYARYSAPIERGGRYFYTMNRGLEDHAVLYWTDGLRGTRRVLLNPNLLSRDGSTSLARISVSHDGRYLAYAISRGGSDWNEWRVREVESGDELTDRLRWVKFSDAAWTPDGRGFYYSRYPALRDDEALQAANYDQKVFYHRLGSPQESDELVFEKPEEKEWGYSCQVTDDGGYVFPVDDAA